MHKLVRSNKRSGYVRRDEVLDTGWLARRTAPPLPSPPLPPGRATQPVSSSLPLLDFLPWSYAQETA